MDPEIERTAFWNTVEEIGAQIIAILIVVLVIASFLGLFKLFVAFMPEAKADYYPHCTTTCWSDWAGNQTCSTSCY